MASISNDPNGRRRILFIGSDGKRRPIRLGKVSLRYAESVKVKVEDLVAASMTGDPPRNDTSRWLADLDDSLYQKLVAVGLARPRECATLGQFTQGYIDGRADIKPRTRINLERARAYLLSYFPEVKPLRDITPGDSDDFRQHLIREGKASNTVNRAIGRASQFFTAAKRRRLIDSNPFEGLTSTVRANHDKFHFISREDAEAVIASCPNSQWKLIFALARFGGLRCPSEVLALTWSDVNWERNRLRVPSPKTEHHEGGESRIIPIFPELRPHLLRVFDEAEPGTEFVITRYRCSNANLRTQLHRIIRKAGLEPWQKTFQNLRSTRETELAEEFPMHVVCKWIGNSQPVAAQHYLQLTDEHFERAIAGGDSGDAAQKAAQKAHASSRTSPKPEPSEHEETPALAGAIDNSRECSEAGEMSKVPPEGLEPSTR